MLISLFVQSLSLLGGTIELTMNVLGQSIHNFNIYGVSGLKIADLSVVPLPVAANTYNTALMLREKAAAILLMSYDLMRATLEALTESS